LSIGKDDGLLQILQNNFVEGFVTSVHSQYVMPSARTASGHDERWS
jgi:hypothetical protein